MEIIPAMYILDGRCVALYKGSFDQKETYYKSPIEMIHFFENGGATKLHLVDLNSLKEGKFIEQPVIKKIIETSKMEVQLEASFHTLEDIKAALASGAKKVVLRPFVLDIVPSAIQTFGADKIIVEIQSKGSGAVVMLVFSGTPTVTDGSNLKLNGNFTASADDTLTLGCAGANWYEGERSVN
jgi:phosphoribosylformimino-5-aminoimidazole carboxamide ribotide isomerase